VELALRLHDLTAGGIGPSNISYQDWARRAWEWFRVSSLVDVETHLVLDGLSQSCVSEGSAVWTYNQGVVLGAAWRLHAAQPGDAEPLGTALRIADAALLHLVDCQGVLREQCEETSCDHNGQQFKGIFATHLAEFTVYLHGLGPPFAERGKAFADFLLLNAERLWESGRDVHGTGAFLARWGGARGWQNGPNGVTHTSGMACILAAALLLRST